MEPPGRPDNSGDRIPPAIQDNPVQLPEVVPIAAVEDNLQAAGQAPVEQKHEALNLPENRKDDRPAVQKEQDNGENTTRSSEGPVLEEAAELPVWNEAVPREKPDIKAVTRQHSDDEKTNGRQIAAAVLLLSGGGITVAAASGAGRTVTKLLAKVKKSFYAHSIKVRIGKPPKRKTACPYFFAG